MRKPKYKVIAHPDDYGEPPGWSWDLYPIDQDVPYAGTVLIEASNQRKLCTFTAKLWRANQRNIPQNAQFLWELWNTKADG